MKKITRRTVLRASGLAAASLALSGCAPTGSACVGNGFSDWLQQTFGKGGSAASSESTEAAARTRILTRGSCSGWRPGGTCAFPTVR